jgi:hypothetical protein
VATLEDLSRQIARSARPSSARKRLSDSDLYTWRDIFTQYIESEVFESTAELDRGDRSYEESEARLQTFTRRIGASGIKLSKSGQGTLERFLQLNVYLLNVKKVNKPRGPRSHLTKIFEALHGQLRSDSKDFEETC